jgi:ABC-type antimicrobial peptide transport system permease subunit
MAFLPIAQAPHPYPGVTFVMRSSLPVERLAAIVRGTMADRDPNIRYTFDVLQRQISSGMRRERLMAALSGGFGLLAALISAIGIYGVFAYMMARRRSEIGIRMALGASRREIVGMVLRETAALIGIGLVAGLSLATAGAKAAAALLYGLGPHDPATLAAACAAITLLALVATWLPARRAARLDPVIVLRGD